MLGSKTAQKVQYLCQFKKVRFHSNKLRFLGYIVLIQRVKIKDDKIKAMKKCLEIRLAYNIYMFISLATFIDNLLRVLVG